jgi:hypothetical protein
VKGFELRGGPSNSPAGIFWALDTVFRASYVGGTAIFSFDTISNQTSVLSSSGMIEYDGLFFWPGVDRFYVYNGVIQEVENNYNINYFFDNLNWTYRQKVWATKVPRWGEIWFFYPHGDSVECNNALIFNIRERVWYDAGLNAPGATRSSGYFSQVFRFPAWFGTTASDVDKYQAMQHESGTDAIVSGVSNAVRSYFETPDISLLTEGPMQSQHIGDDRQLKIERIELDFVQTGDMTVEYRGKAYPRSADVDTSQTFSPTDEYLSPREQRRFLRLRFEQQCRWRRLSDGQAADPSEDRRQEAVMVIPDFISFDRWAASLMVDYPSDDLPLPPREDGWVAWARFVVSPHIPQGQCAAARSV